MRKLVIAIVVVVVLVVGLMLALPHLIDVNQYRGQIQAELQKRLNRPVQLGQMSLGVFPLRVEVNNVTIGEDPSFGSNVPFAQVEQLNVSVKLLPLLSKNIEVDSLELKQAKIEIDPQSAGRVELLDRWQRSCACRRSRRRPANRTTGKAAVAQPASSTRRLRAWPNSRSPTARLRSPTIRSTSRAASTTTLT